MSAKARGLGRGLDALLPKVEKRTHQAELSELRVSPLQPRKRLDDAAIAELAASIADKGVLQPLLVRPVEGGFEIVAGERRYRAAEQAGLTSVPVVVKELDDREMLEVAIVENLQREDLTPVEEARAFRRLMDFGLSQEAVAEAVGKSRSSVANALRLLNLPDETLAALDQGVITAGHARAVLSQPENDRLWAFQQIVGRGLNVREAEALQRRDVSTAKKRDVFARRHERLEEDLSRHAGTRVQIRGGSKGKIEFHFHSEDELQRLLELVGYRA